MKYKYFEFKIKNTERVGFEPTVPVARNNRFRDGHFQPLSHLSNQL